MANSDLNSAYADHSRRFENNTYVYPVISRRAGGISIGVNLNINKKCNYSCVYCQVDRNEADKQPQFSFETLYNELIQIIQEYRSGELANFEAFKNVPEDKKTLKDISISGDGEATTRPEFLEVCKMLAEIQKTNVDLNIKLVLITNATMLTRESVKEGIGHLTAVNGELWTKLDAGTQEWFDIVDRSSFSLDTVVKTIADTARTIPIQVQTMICSVKGDSFDDSETDAYIAQLHKIVQSGAKNVKGIQLYSVARQTTEEYCSGIDHAHLITLQATLQTAFPTLPISVY
ncbi:MAG: hypothetical protein OCC49_01690 [Fibrobacterales bacterium]